MQTQKTRTALYWLFNLASAVFADGDTVLVYYSNLTLSILFLNQNFFPISINQHS
jgi:hypothetical protein